MTVGIVTGAARGMGAACAARVADVVDVLLLVDRDEVLLATQADMLAAAGHRAQVEPFVLDIGDADGIDRLTARVSELGPLRAVAHAAGVSPTMADWRDILTSQPGRYGAARRELLALGIARDGGCLLRAPLPRCLRSSRATSQQTSSSTIRWPAISSRTSARRSGPRSRIQGWPTRGASEASTGWCGGRPCVLVGSAPPYLLGHAGDDRHTHGATRSGGPRHERHARGPIAHPSGGPARGGGGCSRVPSFR